MNHEDVVAYLRERGLTDAVEAVEKNETERNETAAAAEVHLRENQELATAAYNVWNSTSSYGQQDWIAVVEFFREKFQRTEWPSLNDVPKSQLVQARDHDFYRYNVTRGRWEYSSSRDCDFRTLSDPSDHDRYGPFRPA